MLNVKLVLEDLSNAIQIDRERAFEAGRLREREQAFDARQEAYERGVADTEARIIKLIEIHIMDYFDGWHDEYDTAGLIALIKGENNAN